MFIRKTLLPYGSVLRHHHGVSAAQKSERDRGRSADQWGECPVLYFWLLWSFTLTNSMNSIMAASSNRIMLGPLVAAIDQGTSSTRFLVSRILRTLWWSLLKWLAYIQRMESPPCPCQHVLPADKDTEAGSAGVLNQPSCKLPKWIVFNVRFWFCLVFRMMTIGH